MNKITIDNNGYVYRNETCIGRIEMGVPGVALAYEATEGAFLGVHQGPFASALAMLAILKEREHYEA